ncbi:MAG: ribonuclease P protein component [Anaerolineae bacterium]|nr:ribonuclease P protein component [Anaerolineae bacterium]
MLRKKYRLTRTKDFQRTVREGQCYSNQMAVLCKHPNGLPHSRFGFSVSRRLGKAVVRNRIKRLLREVIRLHLDLVAPGWDIVIIARKSIVGANYWTVEQAVTELLSRAQLFVAEKESA